LDLLNPRLIGSCVGAPVACEHNDLLVCSLRGGGIYLRLLLFVSESWCLDRIHSTLCSTAPQPRHIAWMISRTIAKLRREWRNKDRQRRILRKECTCHNPQRLQVALVRSVVWKGFWRLCGSGECLCDRFTNIFRALCGSSIKIPWTAASTGPNLGWLSSRKPSESWDNS